MGILTNRVEKHDIKAGDHIYTYRAALTYSHHGIFVGENKVVHFAPEMIESSGTQAPRFTFYGMSNSSSTRAPRFTFSGMSNISVSCPHPDCGFRQPNSGVVLTCLDCFLLNGSLYRYKYGVGKFVLLSRVRGGTCTTATSDPPQTVINRAKYLLQSGFGNYDVLQNNCEDFALYCTTGLLTVDRVGGGSSGQVTSFIVVPTAAIISSAVMLFMPSPVGFATVTAGMYCMGKYSSDIGVRTDVSKVAVEDVAVKLGCPDSNEVAEENNASEEQIVKL